MLNTMTLTGGQWYTSMAVRVGLILRHEKKEVTNVM